MKHLTLVSLILVLWANATWAESNLGPVTKLPIPRFVSLKANEGNMRRGPSLSHRIDWVLKRRNMPLEVVAEHGHWRKVVDRDGAGGWVHYALLSGNRTVIIEGEMLDLLKHPVPGTQVTARFEGGVVARLLECNSEWCRVRADGNKGWARKADLFGVYAHEIRD